MPSRLMPARRPHLVTSGPPTTTDEGDAARKRLKLYRDKKPFRDE